MVRIGRAVVLIGFLGTLVPALHASGAWLVSRSILVGEKDGQEPLVPGAGVKPPELIERVQPEYPLEERRAGIEGKVVLELDIDEQGKVIEATVLRDIKDHPAFSEAAKRAVFQWRYRPAIREGAPVKVHFVVVIQFTVPSRTEDIR